MFKRKNKNDEDYLKIKDYCTRALELLESDKPAEAARIILNEMSARLYDMYLDILDNSNSEFSDEELRGLVQKVDDKLTSYSIQGFDPPKEEEDPEPDIEDQFSNNTF